MGWTRTPRRRGHPRLQKNGLIFFCAIFAGLCALANDTQLSAPPLADYAIAAYEQLTPEQAETLAYAMADKYDLAALGLREDFVATMRHESKGFIDSCIQSEHPGDGPNNQENSFGYAQFWLTAPMETPDGRPITKEIACDPVQALDAAAWHFSEGRASKWSSYAIITK